MRKGWVLRVSKLKLQIFEGGAECVFFDAEGSEELTLELSRFGEVPVSLGTHIRVAKGGFCKFTTAHLSDGIYPVSLFIAGRAVTAGIIEKKNGILSLASPTPDYVRELSLREYRLEERVSSLEETVRVLSERINGTRLFGQN